MIPLNNYTLNELLAMKDLMDLIDTMLSVYVTNDFMRMTGLRYLQDDIDICLCKVIKEDEKNAQK